MDWGPAIRPTRAEIDLDHVVSNAERLSDRAGSPVLAVVKADAYGHGATEVSLALEKAGSVAGFAVSLVEEGIELRDAGIRQPIVVMGPSIGESYAAIVEHSLTPMVSDERHLAPLAEAAGEEGLAIHLKVDTGMNRLGLPLASVEALLERLSTESRLPVTGIASHLACADIDDPEDASSMTATQLRRFSELSERCRTRLGSSVSFHLANSAGILRFPAASYDLARPGIALYGNGFAPEDGLEQALRLCSQVTQLREVADGESVSYGARWTARRLTRAAIVPVGYADGLPRNLSGKGSVLISGRRCPIIGTVSMDMIVVDVTDLPGASVGADVVLIGRQGQEEIRVAEIAGHCDISEYEVSCGISKRVPRTYLGSSV
jgi:alanine racemase